MEKCDKSRGDERQRTLHNGADSGGKMQGEGTDLALRKETGAAYATDRHCILELITNNKDGMKVAIDGR